jgi:hypothetical protein
MCDIPLWCVGHIPYRSRQRLERNNYADKRLHEVGTECAYLHREVVQTGESHQSRLVPRVIADGVCATESMPEPCNA